MIFFCKNILYISWQYLRAFLLIYLCLIIGNLISNLLPFSLPGSIIGMLMLFSLLTGSNHTCPLDTTRLSFATQKYDIAIYSNRGRHNELL
ncbi:Antiholin-like protein LrgA [Arsenophonus endosymbiont of Bemisia tabaci Q2]|nr:Antiholin-like protein LrgA [Arsenophonus endosymbiont of Bemisia tabaci Q2]